MPGKDELAEVATTTTRRVFCGVVLRNQRPLVDTITVSRATIAPRCIDAQFNRISSTEFVRVRSRTTNASGLRRDPTPTNAIPPS